MNTEEWLEAFDRTKDQFHWFFTKYGFEAEWCMMQKAREKKNIAAMKNDMNKVWFELPDNIFNIREMPKGWKEFLFLLED